MTRYLFNLVLCIWLSLTAWAGEYHLLNGNVERGDPVSFNEEGVVIRRGVGDYSSRISWSQLTQESLKELAQIPQARPYATPFIEIPPEVKAKERARRRHVDVKPVERPSRPQAGARNQPLLQMSKALITKPAGLVMVALLFLANLFAAFEIAFFRNRPPALVCSVSAILPVIGPILFLSLPPAGEAEYAPIEAATPAEAGPAPVEATGAGAGPGGLSLKSKTGPAVSTLSPGMTYKRGETNFNRRFFETSFPGFFRLVPGEAEKDLLLAIKSPRGEYLVKRISRISSNEMHVQLARGTSEVMVTFSEIIEVQVRHKEAKG